MRLLGQVRAQPLTPGGKGAHLRRLQPRGTGRGRAVVLASGAPATLVRTLPWYTGPHKEAVEASIKANSPRRDDDAGPVPAGGVAAVNPWVTK